MFIMSNYIVGQSTFYVNDGSTTGDAYTSAIGNDLTGTGSQSAPYATIAKAMSVITTGAIYVDAGNYSRSEICKLRGRPTGQVSFPKVSDDRVRPAID